MNAVILLAGGKSERMGQPKGFVMVEGKPLIRWQVDALKAMGAQQVIVVSGHVDYAPTVAEFADCVRNDIPEEGPFSSLLTGLTRLDLDDDVFVLPLDVPCPHPSVWAALPQPNALACVPTFDGRGGHPVWLSSTFVAQLRQHSRKHPCTPRLDELLRPVAQRIAVNDARILLNWNRPEDVHLLGGSTTSENQ